jgi:tetratricopeptide (TPR) repeat protein
MTTARAWLPAALAALLAAASPAGARAEPDPRQGGELDEAREHARRGAARYREGKFAAALAEFQRAYALAPNYRVLYNVGQTQAELQDYAAAVGTLERYLSEGGAQIPQHRRAAVEAEVAKLSARVASVQVQVNVDGADVLIDGTPVGRSPLAGPLRVNAGVRTVAASKPPLVAASRSVQLAGRDQATVALELVPPAEPPDAAPAPPPAAAPTPPPQPQPPPTPAPATPWVGIALTGVFAAGATVTGLLTLDARRDFNRELAKFPSSEDDSDRARTRMHALAISTDVLAVAALATAAISAYPFVFRSPAKGTTAALAVRVGPTGVALGGRF